MRSFEAARRDAELEAKFAAEARADEVAGAARAERVVATKAWTRLASLLGLRCKGLAAAQAGLARLQATLMAVCEALPTREPTEQQTSRLTSQPTNQPASQPPNQPPNQPTSQQPANQPVSQPAKACYCPVSLAFPQDPVLATDGHTYDRPALQRWLRQRAELHLHQPTNQPTNQPQTN